MKILIFFIFFILSQTNAFAACSSPTGSAGLLKWISSANNLQYCDGTTWNETSQSPGVASAGAAAGLINYNAGSLRFSDGANWNSMKGSSLGPCSGSAAGTFLWDSALGTMKMCDGTNWYNMKKEGGGFYTHNYGQGCHCVGAWYVKNIITNDYSCPTGYVGKRYLMSIGSCGGGIGGCGMTCKIECVACPGGGCPSEGPGDCYGSPVAP